MKRISTITRCSRWAPRQTAAFTVGLLFFGTAAHGQEGEATAEPPRAEQMASFVVPLKESDRNDQHPLLPALQLAEKAHRVIAEEIEDYRCTIIRRERIKGRLGPYEFIQAKIRHEQRNDDHVVTPFSVYLHFTKPASVEGREALYVAGHYAGKMFVRRGGQRMAYVSSYIKPDSVLAMRENRYPITEIGFERMVARLREVIEHDLQYDECEVNFYRNAKVGERNCTRIEVIHPTRRDYFNFHRAMVFVDDQDQLPVGYVAYTWPRQPGGKPRLLEEYIYTNIELNVGLTDEDFDRDNPAYGFARDSSSAADNEMTDQPSEEK